MSNMKYNTNYLMEYRISEAVRLLLAECLTIREIAKKLKVSKSTIHKDLKERVKTYYSSKMIKRISDQLDMNKRKGVILGGINSHKNKYSPTH